VNKPKVRKRHGVWRVELGDYRTEYSNMYLEDWHDAMHLANNIAGKSHLSIIGQWVIMKLENRT